MASNNIEGVGIGWYSEVSDLWPGQAFSLKVKSVLHEEKTKYQDLKILDTETYGTTLILDDAIQCTERDEFAYQEMISFIPLCFHPDPKNVLIVGGGDGGVAREVQKFGKVKTVHQVEIDERVVELSKKFLPNMACGFESPKVNLFIGDGFEFMKNHKGEFDVIITDSSDPVGPAESLFQESYFSLMKEALRPNGIVCSQGGTYWAELPRVKQTLQNCRKIFPTVRYASAHVPSYPCGQIGFVIGSLETGVDLSVPRHILTDEQVDAMNLRYYTPRTHRAAFDLPRYFEKEIASIIA